MWDRSSTSRFRAAAGPFAAAALSMTMLASCGGTDSVEDAGSSAVTGGVTSPASAEVSSPATSGGSTPVEETGIGALLVTEDDVDFLYQNGDPPIRQGDEYYEAPPEQICDGGVTADMLAEDDVFTLLDGHDDWVFFGQWISSEAVDDASARFETGAEVLTSCLDISYPNDDGATIEFVSLAVDDLGLDDLQGATVVRDGTPIMDFVYARQGGLLTAMYFDYRGYTWPEEEKAVLLDVAVQKLLDAEQ